MVEKFKDEIEGNIITRFVGLRSKLYSLTIQNKVKQEKVVNGVKNITIKYEEKQKKVAKGVKKCVIEKNKSLMIMMMC